MCWRNTVGANVTTVQLEGRRSCLVTLRRLLTWWRPHRSASVNGLSFRRRRSILLHFQFCRFSLGCQTRHLAPCIRRRGVDLSVPLELSPSSVSSAKFASTLSVLVCPTSSGTSSYSPFVGKSSAELREFESFSPDFNSVAARLGFVVLPESRSNSCVLNRRDRTLVWDEKGMQACCSLAHGTERLVCIGIIELFDLGIRVE